MNSQSPDRLPPHSIEAEQALLGCVLWDQRSAENINGELRTEWFYEHRHQILANTIKAMGVAGQPVDTFLVAETLRRSGKLDAIGGLTYLADLPNQTPSPANWTTYRDILQELATLRRIVAVSADFIGRAYETTGPEAKNLLVEFEVAIETIRDQNREVEIIDGKRGVGVLVDFIEQRFNLQGALSGIATGFSQLDSLTDGLQSGEQFIIAARPSVGKTALAINILDTACLNHEIPTLFITLESAPRAILRRLLSCHERIPLRRLVDGKLVETDHITFPRFTALLGKRPIHLMDCVGGIDSQTLSSTVRRLTKKHGIRLVIVDYLQKIRPNQRHEKRTYEVASVSQELKAMAEKSNVALLSLAQLNREPEKEKGRLPRLSDLADSAQIERDADAVGLLHRPRDPGTKADLVIAKQRDGELGIIPLYFDGTICKFSTLDPRDTYKTTNDP